MAVITPKEIPRRVILAYHRFVSNVKFIVGKDGLRARHRRFGLLGLLIIISSIVTLSVGVPIFLETETALKKGWFMRKIWKKSPFPKEFRIYVFNVTNPVEIGQGKKPIVREVGPFIYDVWREKTKVEDHENDDTVTYSEKNTYYFNQERSQCLTENSEFTVAHCILLGLPIVMMNDKPSLLPNASEGIDLLFDKPDSVFVKTNIQTYLFDGFKVDCRGKEEFSAKFLCNELKDSWFKYRFKKLEDNLYSFSMFGYMNDTDAYTGTSRIRRGLSDIKRIGELLEHNHMTYMSVWKDNECDAIRGTNGDFFQPFLHKRTPLHVTNTFYCRNLVYRYDNTVKYAGLKLYRYTTSLGANSKSNPQDKCYCARNRCKRDGVYDLWKCTYTAVTVSNPHFYLADPSYVSTVEGIEPKKQKHMMILDIDPLTGWPVRVHFRFQFNYQMMKLPKYKPMKDFTDTMLPLVWVDQVALLPNNFLNRISHFYKIIYLSRILCGMAIFFGIILCLVTGFHEFRQYKIRLATRKITIKYASKWKSMAKRGDKRTMGISLRTIKTLKMMQKNQIAAAAAAGTNTTNTDPPRQF